MRTFLRAPRFPRRLGGQIERMGVQGRRALCLAVAAVVLGGPTDALADGGKGLDPTQVVAGATQTVEQLTGQSSGQSHGGSQDSTRSQPSSTSTAPADDAGALVSNTAAGTVDAAAQTVGRTVGTAGQTVSDTTQAVADTTQALADTTQAVAQTTTGVTQAVADTTAAVVQSVGQTTSTAVGTVTNVAASTTRSLARTTQAVAGSAGKASTPTSGLPSTTTAPSVDHGAVVTSPAAAGGDASLDGPVSTAPPSPVRVTRPVPVAPHAAAQQVAGASQAVAPIRPTATESRLPDLSWATSALPASPQQAAIAAASAAKPVPQPFRQAPGHPETPSVAPVGAGVAAGLLAVTLFLFLVFRGPGRWLRPGSSPPWTPPLLNPLERPG